MIISIKVIASAKTNLWKQTPAGVTVYLTAPTVDGKANRALANFLSGHFHVSKSRIKMIKGLKSRHKTIMIEGIQKGSIC